MINNYSKTSYPRYYALSVAQILLDVFSTQNHLFGIVTGILSSPVAVVLGVVICGRLILRRISKYLQSSYPEIAAQICWGNTLRIRKAIHVLRGFEETDLLQILSDIRNLFYYGYGVTFLAFLIPALMTYVRR